jgi:hypothetical protein
MATTRRETTDEEIARRAYEISQSDTRGTDEENWWRAEHELRDSQGLGSGSRVRRTATKSTEPGEKTSRGRTAKPAAETKRRPAS